MSSTGLPPGYHNISPYFTLRDAARFIDFVCQVFQGDVTEKVMRPDGTVGHAEIRIGDSLIMLGEVGGNWEPNTCALYVYVPDVDAVYARALAAGSTSLMEPADQFYGDRSSGVKDSWGNTWWIGTHKETLSADELARRAQQAMGGATS